MKKSWNLSTNQTFCHQKESTIPIIMLEKFTLEGLKPYPILMTWCTYVIVEKHSTSSRFTGNQHKTNLNFRHPEMEGHQKLSTSMKQVRPGKSSEKELRFRKQGQSPYQRMRYMSKEMSCTKPIVELIDCFTAKDAKHSAY